jgi:hypothetical protein
MEKKNTRIFFLIQEKRNNAKISIQIKIFGEEGGPGRN